MSDKNKKKDDLSADELIRQLLENLGEEDDASDEPAPLPEEPDAIPGSGKYGAVYRFTVRHRETADTDDPAVAEAALAALLGEKTEEALPGAPEVIEEEPDEEERERAAALAESIGAAEEYVSQLADRAAAGEITSESLPVISEETEEEDEPFDGIGGIAELEAAPEEDEPFVIPDAYDEAKTEEEPVSTGTTDEFNEISSIAKEAVEAEAAAAEAAAVAAAVEAGEAAEETAEEVASPISELDEVDVNLMDIFGMDKELQEQLGTEEFAKLKHKDADEDLLAGYHMEKEYTDYEQNKEILSSFRSRFVKGLIRLVLAVAALIVAGVFELGKESILAGKLNPEYLKIYMLGMLQLTLVLGALALPEIIRAFKLLFKGKPIPELVVTAGVITNLIYEIILLATRTLSGVQTFNLPLAVCVITAIVYTLLSDRRDLMSFKVISARRPKYAIAHLRQGETDLEKDAFGEFLDESSEIFGVKKTDFVENFAANSALQGAGKGVTGIVVSAALIASAVFFVLGFFKGTGAFSANFSAAAVAAQLCMMFVLPACAFTAFALPFFKASKDAFRNDSAIIGDGALEEYAGASVISFNDDSAFPQGKVKLRSMRLYGNNRIDVVLYKVASVFSKLGGPLDTVFHSATKDLGTSEDTEVIELRKNGVDASVDGSQVLIGSAAFMRSQGFRPPVAEGDEALEYQSQINIMYIAIDGALAAKIYVEYRLDAEFEDMVRALYRSGMCIGIRTLDPNIDDVMLDRRIKLSKYPVRVLKCQKSAELGKTEEKMPAGIVSKKSVKSLLHTLTYCDKVLQITRLNLVVALISMIAGLAITTLMFVFGNTATVSPIYLALYQLFWLIPTAIISWLLV